MFPNRKERNIPERNSTKITQIPVGKDHTGHHIRVHAVIGAPVIGVGFERNIWDFAESRFSRASVSGRVAHYQVWTEAGIGTGIYLVFEAHLLNEGSLVRI